MRLRQVTFTPSGWIGAPVVTLDTYVAGETGGANITFTPYNPLPGDGKLVVQFPANFVHVAPTEAWSDELDGLLSVNVTGYTVTVIRDGRWVTQVA